MAQKKKKEMTQKKAVRIDTAEHEEMLEGISRREQLEHDEEVEDEESDDESGGEESSEEEEGEDDA